MNCHNCGQPIYEDDLFCPYCGMNNPEAEALAASRAAGASMQASETDAHYYPPPPDQEDYFEDEYEEVVPEKNPIVPIMLAVAAAVVLIAGILILLLKSGGSDDNKLLFTQPEDNGADNGIINWQTLPNIISLRKGLRKKKPTKAPMGSARPDKKAISEARFILPVA